jgi:hypothetical protein
MEILLGGSGYARKRDEFYGISWFLMFSYGFLWLFMVRAIGIYKYGTGPMSAVMSTEKTWSANTHDVGTHGWGTTLVPD